MKTITNISVALGVLVLLALCGAGYLFYIQNALRTVNLSLNLSVASWQLAEPIPVPVLMAGCLGAGVVLGWGTVGMVLGLRRSRRQMSDRALRDASEAWPS